MSKNGSVSVSARVRPSVVVPEPDAPVISILMPGCSQRRSELLVEIQDGSLVVSHPRCANRMPDSTRRRPRYDESTIRVASDEWSTRETTKSALQILRPKYLNRDPQWHRRFPIPHTALEALQSL